ncbi:Transcriptional regulatory protein PHO23, partial [Frankliniella fusca]
CSALVHEECSINNVNQNNPVPQRICTSCYCLLCKCRKNLDHICHCSVCSEPVDKTNSLCYRCEKIIHLTCSEEIVAPEKNFEIRVICSSCLCAAKLNISSKAYLEIRSNDLLCDEHVSRASSMLRSQFQEEIGGLHAPLAVSFGMRMDKANYYPHRERQEDYVQLMHTGSSHWVTCIFQKGSGTATILDSLRNNHLPGHVKIQAAMIAHVENHLTIIRPPCKQQSNAVDCALFAIANATEFCFSKKVQYIDFDSEKLREHWIDCLHAKKMSPFPRLAARPKKTREEEDCEVVKINCPCRLPDIFDDLVGCDNCDKWFHLSCVNLKSLPEGEWFCSSCPKADKTC